MASFKVTKTDFNFLYIFLAKKKTCVKQQRGFEQIVYNDYFRYW